jgi:hypothetical protein
LLAAKVWGLKIIKRHKASLLPTHRALNTT